MRLYGLVIFLSACLLFQVEFIIAKYILPWFGGSTTVWSICMLFFQTVLIGGYAYAHHVSTSFRPRTQSRLHLGLLGASLATLLIQAIIWSIPLLPSMAWKGEGGIWPGFSILLLLVVSIGLPFFVLSTNATLLQAWFGRQYPDRSPYPLYALSNAGSLIGLLAYPFLMEPSLGLRHQSMVWTGVYVLFALGLGWITVHAARSAGAAVPPPSPEEASADEADDAKPTRGVRVLWLSLPAIASCLLLATTNQVADEVAVIPFFWAIPLALYLLSFILTFSSRWLYARGVFVIGGLACIYLLADMMHEKRFYTVEIARQLLLYYGALFVCCMLCHGEVARLKPPTRHLTRFYLDIAIGGALGSLFVAIIAPLIFRELWELYIGYAACGVAVFAAAKHDAASLLNRRVWKRIMQPLGVCVIIVLMGGPFLLLANRMPQGVRNAMNFVAGKFTSADASTSGRSEKTNIAMMRNFYGILRVEEIHNKQRGDHRRMMHHGQTIHGSQLIGSSLDRHRATTYYTADSAIGRLLLSYPRLRRDGAPIRVGVIGLGTGTLAVYGRPGDVYRFYEINPAVIELAASDEALFTFIGDSDARVQIVEGDARLSLEREEPQGFDVLVLDAFSGDSIPVHLLTTEAMAVYMHHLAEHGVMAMHISNRYLDLRPLLWLLARQFDLDACFVQSTGDDARSQSASWMLLTPDAALLDELAFSGTVVHDHEVADDRRLAVWTDDFSNIYQSLYRDESRTEKEERAQQSFREGMLAFGNQSFDAAIELLSDAIEQDPQFVEAYVNRGSAYAQTGDAARALTDYNAALGIDADDALALYSRAEWYNRQGDASKALADYNAALRQNPDMISALYNRGKLHMRLDELPMAEADFTRIIELNPRHAEAYNSRGIIHGMRGNHAQALADFNEALNLDPGLAGAAFNRARLHRQAGRMNQALADLTRVLATRIDDVPALRERGVLYLQTKQFAKAHADLSRVIELEQGQRGDVFALRAYARHELGQDRAAMDDLEQAKARGHAVDPQFEQTLRDALIDAPS
jgi:tetratricopeptide (TPR) repeat protein/spermidine synthase